MLEYNCMKQVRTFLILEESELVDEKVRTWKNIEGANHVSSSLPEFPARLIFYSCHSIAAGELRFFLHRERLRV